MVIAILSDSCHSFKHIVLNAWFQKLSSAIRFLEGFTAVKKARTCHSKGKIVYSPVAMAFYL